MIGVKTLFNLRKTVSDIDDAMYIVIIETKISGGHLQKYYPAVCSRKKFERAKDKGLFTVLVPFPGGNNYKNASRTYVVKKYQVAKRLGATPLLENHRLVLLDDVPADSFSNIGDVTKKHGGITFVIPSQKISHSALDAVENLINSYKFNSCEGYSLNGNTNFSGNTVTIITFVNIDHAIPMYSKKADGIGVIISTVIPEESTEKGKLITTSSAAMSASNIRDNYMIVDGISIKKVSGDMSSALISHLHDKIKNQSGMSKPVRQRQTTKLGGGNATYYNAPILQVDTSS